MSQKLIGKIGNPKKSKNHQINYQELTAPLEWNQAVCRVVCNGCKIVGEITLDYAQSLIQVMYLLNKPIEKTLITKKDFRGLYLKISYCEHCSPTEIDVNLEEIPRLN